MKKYHRICPDINLPDDKYRQAQNCNIHAGRNFKSRQAACDALEKMPDYHLFKIYSVVKG